MILENIEGALTLLPSKMKYHSMSRAAFGYHY